MTLSDAELRAVLATVKGESFTGSLARRVAFGVLVRSVAAGGPLESVQFLYASANRNRFTKQGGPGSLYAGDSEDVAAAEVKQKSLLGDFARDPALPATIDWFKVNLQGVVLDLTDPAILALLGDTDGCLFSADWRRLPLSPGERLGQLVFESGRFAAIRWPSVRTKQVKKSGVCYCIFKDRVVSPNFVEFTDPMLGFKETWSA